MGTWLPWAVRVDLSSRMGNGPMRLFLGTVHHVNAGRTMPSFYIGGGGPASVCPTFQIDFDGTTWQFLPLENGPWCQSDGNSNYGAIETAGQPTDPLTPQQVAAHARIVAAYNQLLRMPLVLAQAPGQAGYGWHGMGGAAWGGHTGCPGNVRRAQMPAVLALAGGNSISTSEEDTMAVLSDQQAAKLMLAVDKIVGHDQPGSAIATDLDLEAARNALAADAANNRNMLAGFTADKVGAVTAIVDAMNPSTGAGVDVDALAAKLGVVLTPNIVKQLGAKLVA